MTPDAIQQAAVILADLRVRAEGQTKPIEELPAVCRPGTLAEAYQVQDSLRPLLEERGLGPPIGWKIGCTTPVMQRYLGIPHPCAGTLYRERLYRDHVTLKASDFFLLGLECEIAVRLAADIKGRTGGHSAESVAPAVAEVMTSVEIVDHRFRDFASVSPPSLVADDFFSAACLLSASKPLGEVGDLAVLSGGFEVTGDDQDEGDFREMGEGAAILGHPLNALAWLADHLAGRGESLKAGEVVTLGSVVKTIYPPAGTKITAGFEGLSPVALEVA